jgi:hypothetical protein
MDLGVHDHSLLPCGSFHRHSLPHVHPFAGLGGLTPGS